jgi:methionine-gamma-lyase
MEVPMLSWKLYAAFWYKTSFVDITKPDIVEAAITADTKVLYCETVSNPLLEVAAGLSRIAKTIWH